MNRKQDAARYAANLTRVLRRLFPAAEQQYERECIRTQVFRLADNDYTLRVTWERLDRPEAIEVFRRLEDIVARDSDAYISRYSRFDADVTVNDIAKPMPEGGLHADHEDHAGEEPTADELREVRAALKPRPREVELLVTPDEMIRVWSGSRMAVGGLGLDEDRDGVKYFLRLPTVEEFYQLGREAREHLIAIGVPDNFPPELPRDQVARIVQVMPQEMASKLLGIPDYH